MVELDAISRETNLGIILERRRNWRIKTYRESGVV